MKLKIYKPFALLGIALLAVGNASALAQDTSATATANVSSSSGTINVRTHVKTRNLAGLADRLAQNVACTATNLSLRIAGKAVDAAPRVISAVTSFATDLNVNVSGGGDNNSYGTADIWADAGKYEKSKTYSKTYPIDGNDRIKLTNQYGKIQVNTWDRHEVKVDVVVKVQAEDEGSAQRLLDGVHINDGKDGDDVTFHTEIDRTGGGLRFWDFGNNKKHKIQIDYTVYMPGKTDLNVQDSYGGIELPDLSGKVKISSSYGSVSAQNLSNPGNEIEGSYGSVKAGSIGGAKLDYSYGSVEIDACGSLKADLSYGSFKLRKLSGPGEFDISYVGGFKIDELAGSFKKLKVDASYSSVALGVPGSNNFNFDITTSYGGFNYDDNKVTITSKNPPDGAKHIGPTRNYKGRFGRDGSDGMVNIQTSYGGVNFE